MKTKKIMILLLSLLFIYLLYGCDNKELHIDKIENEEVIIKTETIEEKNNIQDLEIKFEPFIKGINWREKETWNSNIFIKNNQDKMIIIDLFGEKKEINSEIGVQQIIESGKSDKIEISIDHYFFEELAFDKVNITINIYECAKLSEDIKKEICNLNFGWSPDFLSPWEIIENRKETDSPIIPTLIYTKYFNYDNIETPPKEISEEEYKN
jgi:hypothetical protein